MSFKFWCPVYQLAISQMDFYFVLSSGNYSWNHNSSGYWRKFQHPCCQKSLLASWVNWISYGALSIHTCPPLGLKSTTEGNHKKQKGKLSAGLVESDFWSSSILFLSFSGVLMMLYRLPDFTATLSGRQRCVSNPSILPRTRTTMLFWIGVFCCIC